MSIFTEDVKGLGIGLRSSKVFLTNDQFRQRDTSISHQIEVVEQCPAIERIGDKSFEAILLNGSYQRKILLYSTDLIGYTLH